MDLALALDFGAGCGAAEFRVAVHGVHLDARVTWGALRKRKVAVGEEEETYYFLISSCVSIRYKKRK